MKVPVPDTVITILVGEGGPPTLDHAPSQLSLVLPSQPPAGGPSPVTISCDRDRGRGVWRVGLTGAELSGC